MAIKVIYPTEKKVSRTFREIDTGDMFIYGEALCLKLNDFYLAEDIHDEVNNEHPINDSDDIESDCFNCKSLSSGAYLSLPMWTNVQTVEAEIHIKKIN